MSLIGILSVTLLILVIIAFLYILIRSNTEYIEYVDAMSQKEFPLKRFLPFGLYILDTLRYSFNSGYDRKILNTICEVYGQDYSSFYTRVFYANKVVKLYVGVICQIITGLFSNFQAAFHFYVLLFTVLIIIFDDMKLKSKVKKRRLEIQLEFPDFINKLTLLLNAGLTMSKAWERIASECNKGGDFYKEINQTVTDIKSGKNESVVYSEFAKRAKSPEISRMMSVIIQNTKKGGTDLVLSLRLQSNECWEMRKNAVKRLGEEASTKLLFPMMIMFFAIIIIVVTPAIISMQGITSNF